MRPLDGHYFRRHGLRVPLPGLPGSTEFNEAYAQALDEAPAPAVIGASRTIPGSVNAMIVGYLGSAAFHHLAPSSQAQYGRIFENMRREHGDKSIAKLERRHVVTMLNAKAATPIGARDFLRCLRLLIAYGIGIGIRADDPTLGLRVKLPKSDGYRTWTEDDIATVEAAYPIGSKPRLALALLLGTALRCADVVRVGRGNVRNGTITITQQKTKTALVIPVTAALAEAINATPSEAMVFLLNEHGKAFTAKGFGKWFTAQCQRVGLTGLSPHGLRKAACRRLAEAGCSANEIAAISGHASLREVERYTKAADQARMARNAMARTTSSGTR
jgi:integrase